MILGLCPQVLDFAMWRNSPFNNISFSIALKCWIPNAITSQYFKLLNLDQAFFNHLGNQSCKYCTDYKILRVYSLKCSCQRALRIFNLLLFDTFAIKINCHIPLDLLAKPACLLFCILWNSTPRSVSVHVFASFFI